MTVSLDGSSESHSVDGFAPQTFTTVGSAVSVALQKQSSSGKLSVEIVRNGCSVKSSDTAAPYGFVDVSIR
jgi:hypothetical protein